MYLVIKRTIVLRGMSIFVWSISKEVLQCTTNIWSSMDIFLIISVGRKSPPPFPPKKCYLPSTLRAVAKTVSRSYKLLTKGKAIWVWPSEQPWQIYEIWAMSK